MNIVLIFIGRIVVSLFALGLLFGVSLVISLVVGDNGDSECLAVMTFIIFLSLIVSGYWQMHDTQTKPYTTVSECSVE